MTDIESALKYLNKDYLLNASIIQPIKLKTADILYASQNCIMIKDKFSDVYMLQTEDLALADSLLSDFPQKSALVVHNDRLARFAIDKLDLKSNVPCFQAVYDGAPFDVTIPFDIHLMDEKDAPVASEMYGFGLDSALDHIRKELIYGGYDGDRMIAMIGLHYQGAMGLLEVAPEYRRRGIGAIMEKFLINKMLADGLVPYCQVIEDNSASLCLQRKLGLKISDKLLYWLHKEQRN